jgi:ApbE superfamily uncharacterized protein (UPF0280 family)
MKDFSEKTYRRRVMTRDLVGFEVRVRETDLWIGADSDLSERVRDLIHQARRPLEAYLEGHPEFLGALHFVPDDPLAPPIVREMIRSSAPAGVGPMASVAGVIAEQVGRGLLPFTSQVMVENGGDVFLSLEREATVTVFAGDSPLSERVGIRVPVRQMPVGVCSSSGTVGHSMSRGRADAVTVVAASTGLADSAATALGNRIKIRADLEAAAEWAAGVEGISGVVMIMGKALAAWGDVELVDL